MKEIKNSISNAHLISTRMNENDGKLKTDIEKASDRILWEFE